MFVKFNKSGIANIKTNTYGYTIQHIAGTREWCVMRYGQCEKISDTKAEALRYIGR